MSDDGYTDFPNESIDPDAEYDCKRCGVPVLWAKLASTADGRICSYASNPDHLVATVYRNLPLTADEVRRFIKPPRDGAYRTDHQFIGDIEGDQVGAWCWKCAKWFEVPLAELRLQMRRVADGRQPAKPKRLFGKPRTVS